MLKSGENLEQRYPAEAPAERSGEISPESQEKAIELIIRVLKFLQEFHRAKTPPVLNLAEQSWKHYFDRLPNSSLIQAGAHFEYVKQLFDQENLCRGQFYFKNGRPTETDCPPPSVAAENWLKPGWETPGVEPQVHVSKTYKNLVGKTVTEAL